MSCASSLRLCLTRCTWSASTLPPSPDLASRPTPPARRPPPSRCRASVEIGACLPSSTLAVCVHPTKSGADDRDRTGDLVLTKDALCQLSYIGLTRAGFARGLATLCRPTQSAAPTHARSRPAFGSPFDLHSRLRASALRPRRELQASEARPSSGRWLADSAHSSLRQPASEGWSGRRGSNPRPTAWKAVTLPLSYSRLRARPLRLSPLRRASPLSIVRPLQDRPLSRHSRPCQP